ncbi:hypothetical protein B5807_10962 [Epicoccum nigrum]|uniref:Uncharacterized protein n=1 Tax=Epicoccum nigrum TaxID=105696 RepID=A0A1Y2LKK4_EPING|nr:hypothetical protein B5807_10962 [Epicoccum nigrum]
MDPTATTTTTTTTTALCLCICIFVVSAAVYDQLTKRIPSRLRADEAPRSASGFVRADTLSLPDKPARAHGIDIVFVHGLGSNPDTTWGPRDNNWVSNFLPQDIPAALHTEIRIFFYNYDSYWKRDAVKTRLWRLGRGLLDGMCSQIRCTEEEQTRSLVFVGHSYGGLVIKRAFILASQDKTHAHVAEHTRGVVFLGTPHRGSSFSTWGGLAARALQPLGSNLSLLQEVEYDALPLLELHEEFESVRSEKTRVVNFFEQRKTWLLKVWFLQWEEFCVREQSATYSGVENIGLPVDHYGLNKFQSKDNDSYNSIVRKLLSLVEPIAAQKQRRLYSVPVNTVETYTERHKLSAAVANGLCVRREKASVPYALAIYGLGGTGKTQLALKYVEDHGDEYSPTLWIDAKDKESVLSSYERCASELQLEVSARQAQSISLVDSPTVQAVLRWLENRKKTDDGWLVVVDNADDLSWGIKKVMPRGGRGSIIITSQDSQARRLVDGGCEAVRVDTMERLEARTLLLRHLQLDPNLVTDNITHDCDSVAEQLGCLALAVDLAGAYISNDNSNPGQALQQYLQRYARHKDSLLRDASFCGLLPSEKTVWTVWDTTFERIEALEKLEGASPDLPARLLLCFLARFRGAVVQDELFRLSSARVLETRNKLYGRTVELPSWLSNALTVATEGWDDYCYEQARARLVRYSLLQRTGGEWPGVSIHGLVQWRARKYKEGRPWEKWYLIIVLAACAQLSKKTARPHFRRELVAHVPTIENLDSLGIEEGRKVFAWHTFSTMYFNEGRWKEAEELQVQVMQTSKTALGEEHPDTLTSMADLASTYWKQGRWKEAEELEVQVMQTRKTALGEEHPDTLTSMANLASTYCKQGRWKEAEELEVKVMQTSKTALGEEHPDTLTSMANLASTYWKQGQWKEAEELQVQVMQTRKTALGEEHPDTLTSMANLASTYWKQGRWKEAEELEVQVMQTRKTALGEEHPDTLTSMDNLASTYRKQRRWREAEELEVQVIRTRKRMLSDEHPDTLTSMANLASTYRNQGRWKEAEELQVQVMQTSKTALGEEHPDTLTSMANLASTYWKQGRWKEAEELQVQVMQTRKTALGEEHPDTLTSMANLASTYWKQGRWKEAEELQVQVMQTSKTSLGEEHPNTLTSMANLASTYWKQGQWKEAEEMQVEVMQTRKRVLGEEHPSTLSSMHNLAFALRSQSRHDEAIALIRTCVRSRWKTLGEEDPNTQSSLKALDSWQSNARGEQ